VRNCSHKLIKEEVRDSELKSKKEIKKEKKINKMLKSITASFLLGIEARDMSCIEHKKMVQEHPLCDRALIGKP